MNNTTSLTKMQRELVAVTEERDRLVVELAKLRAAPAVPAPSVPEEFLVVVERICRMAGEYETAAQARALLQSAPQSVGVTKKGN